MDKLMHAAAGAAITYGAAQLVPIHIAACIGIAAGIAKELFDQWRYGGADKRDLLATMVGAAMGGPVA